ncbi:hypothetical protein BS614_06125 [Paenibacillus xylanexedens]|uniref:hypothetical protein n=1 Tax=Paenibacillus xylanexedens TaxID=528191 RepID=UPI0009386D37|nr:hypothetical protein [Paenibacillus xylanexedens]APO43629.1 hypothetical protein BS614_06125 [Paenibacillus xylanexedens]
MVLHEYGLGLVRHGGQVTAWACAPVKDPLMFSSDSGHNLNTDEETSSALMLFSEGKSLVE